MKKVYFTKQAFGTYNMKKSGFGSDKEFGNE